MTNPFEPSAQRTEDAYLQYRAISLSAISAVVLAVMSLPALAFPKLLLVAVLGAIIGLYAFIKLRNRQDEYIGFPLAKIGTALSFFVLIVGSARAAYEVATEVPEGYERISFSQLKPDKNYPNQPIPPSALELDQKMVFVKGYVHPGVSRREGIRQFILVPDMKTCCFGGQPELTDMIEVTITTDARINYSYGQRKLAGKLFVSPYKKRVEGLDGVYYRLEADYVR